MDVVLPGFSDDEIIIKVAQCAAANLAAAKAEVADWHRQFALFVDEFMQRPAIAAAMAGGPPVAAGREQLGKILADQFVHTISLEAAAVIQAHRDAASQAIPSGVEVQKWGPDTCGCKVYRMLDHRVPGQMPIQAFTARKGAEHQHLSIGDLHDAVERENGLKNHFQGAILRDVPDAAEASYEYKWSFDADRNLVVDVTSLSAQAVAQIRALLTRPEFKGKVIVNG